MNISQPKLRSEKFDNNKHTKARLGESLKKKWKNKVMHGQHIKNIDSLLVKKTSSSGYRRET